VVSQKLGTALGTTLVIENKGGAGGSVGSEIAARAPADGYNLLGGTISSHAINVSLYPKLGYDPIKSFTPVYLYGTNPVVLVVAANSPYKTLRDLLTAAKANPGKLSGASAGNGTSQHLAQELLAFKGEVKFTHVPYKGSAPAGRLHVRHHRGGGRPHPERQTACLGGDFWQALDRHLDRSADSERVGLAWHSRF
jgi:tripartite-type tricarboxylate transporter receptor subunit TctC